MQLRISSKSRGTEFSPLAPGVHWIGRGAECSVKIDGSGIGAKHARLDVAADGKFGIVDLGCPAGTRVNGERVVTAGPLCERDLVTFGDTEIRILSKMAPVERDWREEVTPPMGRPSTPISMVGEASAQQEAQRLLEAARRLHERLLSELDLRRQDVASMADAALRELATRILEPLVDAEAAGAGVSGDELLRLVLDEALGLGPLETLLSDDGIREVMVNGPDTIFVERCGRLERSTTRFSGEIALRGIVERIVSPLGRRIDEASPMVDARLPDGSRVNVVIPPLAVHGTAVTIRRFGSRRITADDLLRLGSLDDRMLRFLEICVRCRRNVLVSGGTGSGKTTLLNVLSSLIPTGERVITIEDSAELAIDHPNLVALETRPRNIEGRGEVTIRDLVRNALRMRPDRIVIGECRGGETLDMLQAMNTGHDGSLSTVHANSPRELLSRIEVMVLMSGVELPVAAIREQIASSVHIVVHQARFSTGTRRITRITEITGVVAGTIQTQDIFRFVQGSVGTDGGGGHFEACGHMPQFYEELSRSGVAVDLSPFTVCEGSTATDSGVVSMGRAGSGVMR
jgi:pilus assembly protein CpaF